MYSWLPGSTQYFSMASQMSLSSSSPLCSIKVYFPHCPRSGLISKCVVYMVVSLNAPAIHASTSERR